MAIAMNEASLAKNYLFNNAMRFYKMLSTTALEYANPYLVEEVNNLNCFLEKNKKQLISMNFIAIGGGKLLYYDIAIKYTKHYVLIDPVIDLHMGATPPFNKNEFYSQNTDITLLKKSFSKDINEKDLPLGNSVYFFLFNVLSYIENPAAGGKLKAIKITSDIERKRLTQQESLQHIDTYSPEMNKMVYTRLQALSKTIITANFDVIVDATFLRAHNRKAFFTLAAELKVPIIILATPTTPESLEQRIIKRRQDPQNVSDATLDVLRSQMQALEPLSAAEQGFTININDNMQQDIQLLVNSIL